MWRELFLFLWKEKKWWLLPLLVVLALLTLLVIFQGLPFAPLLYPL